tara:strand:+ start:129 stop:329 length:201 start_codon:yes stop_codon:yes gene_type:complete
MIEKIIWYLLVLDCLTYTGLTISANWHSKKEHHFWKGIPLHWGIALYYAILVAWLGFALFRLNVLF